MKDVSLNILFLSGLLILSNWHPAKGDIITVDINGGGDFTSIQQGIVAAAPGDTVLVAPGNYVEIVDFLGKDITVASHFLLTQDTSFISQTVIDGNHINHRLVRFTGGETHNARLVGFTIKNAYYGWAPAMPSDPEGLGIYVLNSSPVIEYNRVVGNIYGYEYLDGGGVVLDNSSAILSNNLIRANNNAYTGAGVYIRSGLSVLLYKNIIENNQTFSGYGTAYGAGIYLSGSQSVVIRENIIRNNVADFGYGAGIYLSECDDILIVSNTISDNLCYGLGGGGISVWSSDVAIVNNLITGNHGEQYGGGIGLLQSNALISNNTIAGNKADLQKQFNNGGGLSCEESSPCLINNILYFNSALAGGDQVYLMDDVSDPAFYHCDVEGGTAAFLLEPGAVFTGAYENNIDADPMFANTGVHPYSLEALSPCINKGKVDTAGLYLPPFDLSGMPRISEDTVDIGAYEYQFISGIATIRSSTIFMAMPNPTAGVLTFVHTVPGWQHPRLAIFNGMGKPVFSADRVPPVYRVDLTNLPGGMYYAYLFYQGIRKVQKVIIR
jgi:parallel beta-helix repeat protein